MREQIDQVLAERGPTDDVQRRFFVLRFDLELHDAAHRQRGHVA